MDPSRRRISGDGGILSKQKSPVASDLALSKDTMVSCLNGIRTKVSPLSLSLSYMSLCAQVIILFVKLISLYWFAIIFLLSALVSCI